MLCFFYDKKKTIRATIPQQPYVLILFIFTSGGGHYITIFISIIFSGGFCEIVKHLLIAGGNPDAMTVTGVKPTDLTKYSSEIWNVINEAKQGDLPEIEEISEVCEIPEFSIPGGEKKSRKKSGKGKKGKKGKKKGGKKGGKKKKKK